MRKRGRNGIEIGRERGRKGNKERERKEGRQGEVDGGKERGRGCMRKVG